MKYSELKVVRFCAEKNKMKNGARNYNDENECKLLSQY